MPTESELFAAIHADPEDDAPRLVYADWLQEKGDARGELIQLQCRLEALERDGLEESTERRRIKLREGKLLREHPEWTAPIHRVADFVTPRWRRGFVHGLQIDASRFAESARRIFDALPFLRELTILGGPGEHATPVPDLLREPRMARIGVLELVWYGMEAADAAALAASKRLAGLTRLAVRSAFEVMDAYGYSEQDRITWGDEGARLLAASPHWASLHELELVSCRIGNAGLEQLLLGNWQLERLNVGFNQIDAQGIDGLVRSPRTTGLHTLGLAACGIESGNAERLATSPHLQRLETLDLQRNQIDTSGVRALLEGLPALRSLNLDGNPIGTPGAKAIAAAARDRGLTALSLLGCGIGNAGILALAASPHLGTLQSLKISGPATIDPAMVEALTEASGMPNTKIWLNGMRLAREKRKQEKAKAAKPPRATKQATKQATKKAKRTRSAS